MVGLIKNMTSAKQRKVVDPGSGFIVKSLEYPHEKSDVRWPGEDVRCLQNYNSDSERYSGISSVSQPEKVLEAIYDKSELKKLVIELTSLRQDKLRYNNLIKIDGLSQAVLDLERLGAHGDFSLATCVSSDKDLKYFRGSGTPLIDVVPTVINYESIIYSALSDGKIIVKGYNADRILKTIKLLEGLLKTR